MKTLPPYFIGIGGGTASGKTTFAHKIKELAPSQSTTILAVDSYYHSQNHIPPTERAHINYDHPSSIDSDLLRHHLLELKGGKSVGVPTYDFAIHTRTSDEVLLKPTPIIIVEGILALHYEALRNELDLKIFVEVPHEVRLKRRMSRDTKERQRTEESVRRQWDATVLPMHLQYCEPTKNFADLVIDDTTFDEKALEIIRKVATRVGY